ncbi:MAG TPA: hypothetical protein VKW76_00425 [Candidatus Binatia bacterium]|nr:hypothetical protein [Candidatus Binatia bacterium]
MTRRRWALALGVVALAAALIAAALAALVLGGRQRLLAAAGRALGREVSATAVGISLRGGLGLGLRGVRIADDPAFAAHGPFLTADRLAMRVRLWPLLHRRLIVDEVLVDTPAIDLVRDAAGHLNADSLRRHHGHGREGDGGGRPGRAFQLALLRLRDGTIHYVDQASGRSLDLVDIGLDAHEPAIGAPMPIEARAGLRGRDIRVDGIVSQGVLDVGVAHPSYRGTLRTGAGTLGPLDFTSADAKLAWQGSAGDATFAVDGGRCASLTLGRDLLAALGPLVKPAQADRLRARYPDLFGDQGLRFTRLAGSAHVEGGRLHSDDLVVAGEGFELHGAGDVAADGGLALAVRLAASPALTTDLLGKSGTARALLVDESGRLVVPLRITGPARHPTVAPAPEFVTTVTRGLVPRDLGGAAGSLLERLFKHR